METIPAKQEKKTETIVLKPSPNNKDVIQSYILTTARYDFSVYEKRILYGIVECFQFELAGKKLDKDFSISREFSGYVDIVLPFSSVLMANEGDKHHNRIKKALYSLLDKKIIYENNEVWQAFTLIIKPKVYKHRRIVTFTLHQEVYEALLNFTKGYRKYELKTAMAFDSVYAMRFYELFSGQKNPLTYMIDDLKSMFRLETKYKRVDDFIKYVIEPAKRELDSKSPYSFTYQLEHEKEQTSPRRGRKKIIGITFTPVYHSKYRNRLLEYKELCNALVLSDVLLPEEKQFLLSLGFTEQELKKKYCNLLLDIEKCRIQGKMLITPFLSDYARTKKNPKSYTVKALRKEIIRWKEELLKQKSNRLSREAQRETDAYRRQKDSIRNFLKNRLDFSGDELDRVFDYVLTQGGEECLDELVCSCKDTSQIRECLRNGIKSPYL